MSTPPLGRLSRVPSRLLAALLAAGLVQQAEAAGVSRIQARASLTTPAAGSVAAVSGQSISNPTSLILPSAPGTVSVPGTIAAPGIVPAGVSFPGLAASPAELPLLPSLLPQAQATELGSRSSVVSRVQDNVDRQLSAMGEVLKGQHAGLLASVSRDAHELLSGIQARVDAGDIDPSMTIDKSPGESGLILPGRGAASLETRAVKVGIYPVTADPFHWGHLLIGLQAVGTLGLDKVVFVLAGDDPRKPSMTRTELRHPMGQAVLAAFAPFFEYSPIAIGTDLDGETNMFRLLALNLGRKVHAFYLVGADHYKLTDKNGNPDTLPKIEANMARPDLGFDPLRHSISVAFIERDERGPEVPTGLDVRFLPALPFDASSTKARAGHIGLMPYDAYRWVLDRGLGLYGIQP